uniref:Peptidase C39-like domain-containing protein n=1 Tax=candidate division WOR-3 bacterium TaxID=2052148 RepID=A0A7C6EIY6_UNCW3
MTAPTNSDGTYTALEICGSDSAWVHCKNDPPRYAQGDSRWGNDKYDHLEGETISSKGCALSCMAIVMTAFGDTIDPGKLNTWMKGRASVSQGGYLMNGGVSWYAPEQHAFPKKIKLIEPHRAEMFSQVDSITAKGDTIKVKRLNLESRSNPSTLDSFLERCNLISVSVYNSKTKNQHWVVVTGKSNGRYSIVDPGDRNKQFLDEYGDFWSYMVYQKEE